MIATHFLGEVILLKSFYICSRMSNRSFICIFFFFLSFLNVIGEVSFLLLVTIFLPRPFGDLDFSNGDLDLLALSRGDLDLLTFKFLALAHFLLAKSCVLLLESSFKIGVNASISFLRRCCSLFYLSSSNSWPDLGDLSPLLAEWNVVISSLSVLTIDGSSVLSDLNLRI